MFGFLSFFPPNFGFIFPGIIVNEGITNSLKFLTTNPSHNFFFQCSKPTSQNTTPPSFSFAASWSRQMNNTLIPALIHPSQSSPALDPIRPRNTQGHGLIVNTVKTWSRLGWWRDADRLGGWGGVQIAGSPISSLMAPERGTKELFLYKTGDLEERGGSHTHFQVPIWLGQTSAHKPLKRDIYGQA